MAQLSILFEEEELKHIDNLVSNEISLYLDKELSCAIEIELIKVAQKCLNSELVKNMSLDLEIIPEELKLYAIMTKINADCHTEIQQLKSQIHGQIVAKQALDEQLKRQTMNISDKQVQIQKLSKNLREKIAQNKNSQHQIYQLREQLLMSREQIESVKYELMRIQASAAQKQQQQNQQISNQTDKIKQIKQALIVQMAKNQQLQELLRDIQEELTIEIERRNMNLVTFTIDAAQIEGAYQNAINFLKTAQSIHLQNIKIVQLLNTLQTEFKPLSLEPIQRQKAQIPSYLDNLSNFFDQSLFDTQILYKIGKGLQQKLSLLFQQLKKVKTNLKDMINKQNKASQRNTIMQRQIQQLVQNRQQLQQKIHGMNDNNYRVLLELTESKQKIQKLLEQQQEKASQSFYKIKTLEEQAIINRKKYQSFQALLQVEKKKSEAIQNELRSSKLALLELQQAFKHLKSNIQRCNQSEQSQENLATELIQQNAELEEEVVSLKSRLADKDYNVSKIEQTVQAFEEEIKCIQKAYQTIKLQKASQQDHHNTIIKHKDVQINQLSCQIAQLQQQLQRESRSKKDSQAQTQVLIKQPQIKRQIVHNRSIALQAERSHSLLTDQEQSKQNKQKQSNILQQKFKIKGQQNTRCQKACIEKISALNEIINFMINHIKGYSTQGIRENSWLTDQIHKHGHNLEAKLRDDHHLRSKINNIRFVKQLALSQPSCDKLTKEFQSIMEFYFAKVEQSSLGQQLLEETISRSKINQSIHRNQVGKRNRLNTDIKLR